MGAAAINKVCVRSKKQSRGASVLRQLRRPVHPEGHLAQADGLPECAQGRPHRDGDRAPAAGELAVFKDLRTEIGFGLGVVDIKQTEIESADQIARAIERAEKLSAADA
jgi:hypothetical protein